MDIVLNDGLGSNYQTAKEKRLYQNRNILIQPPLFFYKPLRTKTKVFSPTRLDFILVARSC